MREIFSATRTLNSVLRHHLTQPTLRGLSQDGEERWAAIVQKLDELFTPVAKEIDRIMTDPGRTDEGKSVKLLAVGPKVVDGFRNIGVVVNQADQSIARLEKLIFSPLTDKPKEGDAIVAELRAQEIRRTIGGKGQPAGLAFLAAVEKSQFEVTRALLSWPGGHEIPEDIERRAREAFAQRTNPTAWESLQHVETLREALHALASQVAQWLILLGASPEAVKQATSISVAQPFQVEQLTKYLERTAAKK